jgi:hypothetical protein
MVRELTTKRFLRGCLAMVEFCRCPGVIVADSHYRALRHKSVESRVLEPFKKLFQWCLMASSGYARVDPNNLLYRRYTSSQKEWGLLT